MQEILKKKNEKINEKITRHIKIFLNQKKINTNQLGSVIFILATTLI